MSTFAVRLVEVIGLRGRYDRIAKLIFRDKSYTTDVYEFCYDAEWDEEFDWKVTGSLKPSDFVEIQIMNYNRILRSRVIAKYQMYLKRLIDEPWISITENLVDTNSTVLNSTITLEVMFVEEFPRETTFESFHPVEEKMRILEDWELESNRSKRRGSKFSLTSSLKRKFGSFGSMTSSKRAALMEMGVLGGKDETSAEGGEKKVKLSEKKEKKKAKEQFNLHPKVRVTMKPQRQELDFNVQIRLIEGKQLAGTQLDPVCDIICFGEKKSSQTKEQTNIPFWDEFFVFDTVGQQDIVFDEIIEFRVYSGRNLISKGSLLGTFKIDLGTIYYQPDHRFIRKYACLTNPDETLGASGAGIKGYLKLDITVLARGDPVKEPPSLKDGDDDVDENPLLPENVKPERLRQRICVRIYKAEGLPKMNSGILANVRKQFTGESKIRDLADPFVAIQYAGMEASTSVKQFSYDPEWVEEIIFCDLFPSLCRRIKIQLKDKDVTKDETVGTLWIDLSEISNDGCNIHKFSLNAGFMPTFGPTWVNLYGSTRDYLFIDQNNFLNEGMEEGIGYRGRLLISIQTEEGESASDEQISNIDVKGAAPVSDVVGGKEENFQLFCCIYEASMINRKAASKPIQFEMNIGNFGNTFDGKMLSSKDDDDEEDEEDRFVKPLTTPAEAESLDREYFNMPFHETKPCVHIRFPWEDQRKRLYLQNILHHFVTSLEDSLDDVSERIKIDADDTYEYLQDALKEFQKTCNKVVEQLSGKISGPKKAGKTKLDKERFALCISETKQMLDESKQILDGLKDNSRINSNYNYVLTFRDRIKKLMKEPQTAFPDTFLWLLSGGKRISYVRIPPHQIMYSTVPHECGRDSGKMQTYCLTLPGKSGLGENGWAIHCKLTCLLWLGMLKNKKDMLIGAPEGYELPKGLAKTTAPPPVELTYTIKQKFILRAHMYQARGLIGSDDSGLSDAFGRVIINDQAADTSVIWETRSPTWNQTLMFFDLIIWGDMEAIVENPPTIMAEIFDFDEGGEIEFIGRAMARPLVKRAEDLYEKPLFPPKLEWFQIYRGDNTAGELLAAFELFQINEEEDGESNMPPDPVEMDDEVNGGTFYAVPDDIRPVMAQHRIECLFWGVREMKKIKLQAVDRPQVEFDCVGESVKSPYIASAKKNPNFPEPWAYFDLLLPEEDRYCPPLTISVRDTRMFGKEILVGTCIVNSLLKYLQDSSAYVDVEEGGGDEEVAEVAEVAEGEGEAGEETAEGGEEGQENQAFEGEEGALIPASRRPSLALSSPVSILSKRKSRAPSLAPSKAVSFAPSLIAPSVLARSQKATPAKSILASKKGTPTKSPAHIMTINGTPVKMSRHGTPVKMSQKEIAMAARRTTHNPNLHSRMHTPVKSANTPLRKGSQQSSTIHYHIVSNPGKLSDTPLKKVFTPKRKSKQNTPAKSVTDSMANIGKASSTNVTPFKSLMEKIATPTKSIGENSPLLGDVQAVSPARSFHGSAIIEEEVVESPGKKSIMEQIATPIKALGSKLATPVRSLTGSKAGSQSGSKHGEGNETSEDIDDLAVGAEAADFMTDEEGMEGGNEDVAEAEGEQAEGAEGEVAEGETAEGEPTEGGEATKPEEAPVPVAQQPIPGLDDEEEEEEEEKEEMKVIMVGEEELKAQQEALEEEAENEEEEDDGGGEEGDDEDEDQIDWWSRFYETVKDDERAEEERQARIKKKKKAEAKKGKKTVTLEAEEGEEEEEDIPLGKKKIINPRIVRMKIYKTELEEAPAFDGFNDVVHSFTLLRGKSNGNDDDDESRIYGKFKGAIKVWKYPLPALFDDENVTLGSFKMLPTMDPVNLLCRVYVVKAIDLHPTDLDGKADPYVKVQVGKQIIKDRDNYVPKQLNPSFGRVFDFEVTIPHCNMLTIGVYDYDLVGSDDLIGETKIDIENRFFSRHRATCGMSTQYAIAGFNKWRDPIKPTAILQRLCKDHKLDGPHFQPGKCRIDKWVFCAQEFIDDDNGNPKQSDEPSALKALHNFQMIEGKGYPLVPEHVETRSLLSPEMPGIEQGRVQLWVDLFDMDGPSPGMNVDITPRKPTSYELRVIIWNTEDVILGDINILTGQPCADIYVKGWIDGIKDNKQTTDVHNTSLTGEGNFNWRFLFPFKYHKAEEKIVIIKKASLFSWDTSEEKMPPRLLLQCWDSDALSSDDFIGDVTLNLTNIPRPSKTAIQCNIETMNNENKDSIFKKKMIKGWWPFILNTEESEPELVGKVEAQLELLTEQESEEDPAGLGRKEPNPLPFPDRPDVMMQWMMNPLKALRYFLWEQYKFCLAKFVVIGIIFAIMGLFFYSMPGFIVKKLFGA